MDTSEKIKHLKALEQSYKGRQRQSHSFVIFRIKECIQFLQNPKSIIDKYFEEDEEELSEEVVKREFENSVEEFSKMQIN